MITREAEREVWLGASGAACCTPGTRDPLGREPAGARLGMVSLRDWLGKVLPCRDSC